MNVKMLEEAFEGAKSMYESGDISKEEYLNILRGFDVENLIAEGAEEMSKKEELNKLVNTAINVVSMVA
jgi:hypothetical protein